ncbi:UNVERIFIED_CONTAM: cell surface protein, partial [Lactobacillus paragasseri]|nr:cell surface protein [Lactobacillus paragasseri]
KRINYDGQRKLMNGGVVTTNSKIREAKSSDQNYFYSSANYTDKNKLAFTTTIIKGQDYLSIGKGEYIKIANVKTANGMILFTKGPITITLPSDTTIYSSNFKETKKQIAAGKKVILHKTEIDNSLSDPQLYVRIKGTNELIYWGDLGEYPGVD